MIEIIEQSIRRIEYKVRYLFLFGIFVSVASIIKSIARADIPWAIYSFASLMVNIHICIQTFIHKRGAKK